MGRRVSLGTTYEICNPPPELRVPAEVDPSWNYVLERFELQGVARVLLPDARVAGCLRRRVDKTRGVEVRLSERRARAWYTNLQACGSVWVCPVCAARISENRRALLQLAVDRAVVMEYAAIMVTFTVRHNAQSSLSWLLDGLQEASRRLRRGKAYDKLRRRFHVVGTISALEVTYGKDTGWHPHRHEIWFLRADVQNVDSILVDLEAALSVRWVRMLQKLGLDATIERGCSVIGGSDGALYIAEYVAKFGHQPLEAVDTTWTLAHEVAKSPVKKGRDDRFGPFGLLAAAPLDADYAKAWREYARVFQGRHQLTWSPGLWSLLDMDTPESDEAIAQDVSEFVRLMASLSPAAWRALLRLDKRGELLRVASSGDYAAVRSFLTRYLGEGVSLGEYDEQRASQFDTVVCVRGDV